jgi:hypothetical protein
MASRNAAGSVGGGDSIPLAVSSRTAFEFRMRSRWSPSGPFSWVRTSWPIVTTSWPIVTTSWPIVTTSWPIVTTSWPIVTTSVAPVTITVIIVENTVSMVSVAATWSASGGDSHVTAATNARNAPVAPALASQKRFASRRKHSRSVRSTPRVDFAAIPPSVVIATPRVCARESVGPRAHTAMVLPWSSHHPA